MTDLDAGVKAFDPFADGADDTQVKNYVHIRIQQRNGRKTLTTLQGLNKELDFKKIIKAFKKEFCCNGCVVDDPEFGEVIQLQGDQRTNAQEWIVKTGIAKKASVKIHGF